MSADSFGLQNLPRPSIMDHGVIATLRALASDLASRASFASKAGLTFGGKRDIYSALGYPSTLTPKDYRDRYRRGDIAARIVEAFPKATWREGAELIEDEDPELETDFEQTWEELNKRLNIWNMLSRADILAGLGRYATLLIGARGEVDTPLPKLGGPDGVLYLAVYGEDEAEVDTLVEATDDPRFGQPLTYKIKRQGTRRRSIDRVVHWTRILHVACDVLDEPLYGMPRLERVWNRLDDLEKCLGGGSEAFWLRVHQGTLLNVNPEVKVDKAAIDKLKEEAEDFVNGFKRFLTLRGVEMTNLGSDVSNFSQQVTSLLSIISGATGIPQRMLLGSERGELASTQDKENWDDRVADRRTEFADPLVRQFVDRLVDAGALPEPEEYEVRWPGIEELNTKEKAEVATAWAGLNSKAKGTVVLPEEIRDRVLGLEKLTPKQIAEAEASAKKNTPPPPGVPKDPNANPNEDPKDPEAQVVVED